MACRLRHASGAGCNRAGEALRSHAVRALGLDVGSKTIGVAVSDELGLAAHPVEVIARQGMAADVARIARLVAEREIGDVVVGLPLELSGDVGLRARRVRLLVEALRAHLADAG